jgi:hypothetical protein
MSAAVTEAPAERLDLSDLDGLDNNVDHYICDVCNGGRQSFSDHDVVKTVCGKTLLAKLADGDEPCKPCAEAYATQTCPIHGAFR